MAKNRAKQLRHKVRKGPKTRIEKLKSLFFTFISCHYKEDKDVFEMTVYCILNQTPLRIIGHLKPEDLADDGVNIITPLVDRTASYKALCNANALGLTIHDAPCFYKLIKEYVDSVGDGLEEGKTSFDHLVIQHSSGLRDDQLEDYVTYEPAENKL